MELPTTATLPTVKAATPTTKEAPTPPPATETQTTPTTESTTNEGGTKTEAQKRAAVKPRRSAIDSIAERVDAAMKNGGKEPVKTEEVVEEKPVVEETKPVVDDKTIETDDEIKAEIESKTKAMDAAGRKAFADLRYRERELKRQMKDMVPSAKLTEYETKLADLQTKLEQASGTKQADPAEVETLKTQLKELQDRDAAREQELTAVKVEKTEAFQNAVTKPREAIVAKLEKLSKKYEKPVSELLNALTDSSDNQSDLLIEAASGLNKIEEMEFFGMVTKMRDIAEKEETFRGQAKEALEKITAQTNEQSSQQTAQRRQALEQAHAANWSKLEAALPDILTPMKGDEPEVVAWNEAQTGAKKFAHEVDVTSLKPEVASELIQRGAVHHLLVGALESFKAQIAEKEAALSKAMEELEKFQKSRPGGSSTPRDGTATTTKTDKKDFVANVNARLAEAGFR